MLLTTCIAVGDLLQGCTSMSDRVIMKRKSLQDQPMIQYNYCNNECCYVMITSDWTGKPYNMSDSANKVTITTSF